jgi:hypothetical protein
VTIVTPCRDAAIKAYRRRVEQLEYPADALRVVVVEGDSVDDTWARVCAWADADPRVTAVKHDTGKPRFGSVVSAERFRLLAEVFNAGLDAVDTTWSDYALMLPVDIVHSPSLLRRLTAHGVDFVCPLTWMGEVFYDTWALSVNDCFFPNFSRAWADAHLGQDLIAATTVGGTLLMRAAALADGVRYTPDEVDRGLSLHARRRGYGLYLDPATHVYHPAH